MDQGLNWLLAQAINHLAGHVPPLDAAMRGAASDLVFLVVLGAAVWWFLPSAGDAGKHAALAAAGALVAGQAFNLLVGHRVFVPRPFVAHHVVSLIQAAHDSSFPSDHTTAAFAVVATALLRGMSGRWLFFLGALLIAFARVYVGAHYPLDVVGGALLGTAWAALFLRLDNWLALPYGRAIALAHRLRL